jgi:hypothetical protein
VEQADVREFIQRPFNYAVRFDSVTSSGLKKAVSNENQLVTRHTWVSSRFAKRENIDTYIFLIIYQPNFQSVDTARCYGQLCLYQEVEITQGAMNQVEQLDSEVVATCEFTER